MVPVVEHNVVEMKTTLSIRSRGDIHGPIGIDIGAVTPAEIAVSILAELTASRYGSGSDLELIGEVQRLTKSEYL